MESLKGSTKLLRNFFSDTSTRLIHINDKLQDFVDNYNDSENRIIKMKPNDVTKDLEFLVRSNYLDSMFNDKINNSKKYSIGEKVRLKKKPGAFDKAYKGTFTDKI